jgi:DNA-binding beta-propeller fold protein YncE
MPVRKTLTFLTVSVAILAVAVVALQIASRAAAPPAGASGYHIIKTVPVAGEGGWDYLIVDSAARRLYLSHSTHVVVYDTDSYAVVGEIPNTKGVHGIAIASDLGRGFTSNGGSDSVTIFDLKTLKILGSVKTGSHPDAILYDNASKRVFTFNGGSKDATAFNAADGTVAGTIALGGRPEFAVSDGQGSVYVNSENTSELLHLDAQKLTVLDRWPQAPCKEASGLAMDVAARRIFAGCDNKIMAVINADNGKVVATPAIGDGVDANAFDPGTGYAFSSNGEAGTLTVVKGDGHDNYTVVEDVPTKVSARTMALDLKTHNIFLPAADMIPPAKGERWPSVKPGTFVLLVLGR